MDNVLNKIRLLSKNKTFAYGVPFVVLLLFGSFGVREFTQVRFQFPKNKMVTEEELAKVGLRKTRFSLEEEYEKYKQTDLNAWQNIRGPRPWEEPPVKNTQPKLD